MLLPYRAKNTTKHFPYTTLSLIVINVLVYACTSDSLLSIRESVVNNFAFLLSKSPFLNFFSAIFLHGDPMHLIGNMLFLWVFGPPVEDRLGIPRYLSLYLLTGFAGDILQLVLDSAFALRLLPGIGASGCIMGVVGAYWYLFSWSKVLVAYFYWIFYPHWGVWEVEAIWIVGLYLLMDLAEGLFFGSLGTNGGVANFAHVGGGLAGVLLCMAMRAKRDTEALSEAKAIQSDMKELSMMPLHALETMAEEDPCNPEIIRAMITPAINLSRQNVVHEAFARAGAELIDKDPGLVAHFLVNMAGSVAIYQPVHLLRLCGQLERMGYTDKALSIYLTVVNGNPSAPEAETALYRMALCCWNEHHDRVKAEKCLNEMVRRFPNGPMIQFARTLQRQMST
ncbi:MAG: rhomboid family intramembrane serine protease [Armatimonadetes bacterium]|nr:rhomboid family intramembrane serine protease [Armatimonadota bacterium]